MSFMMMTGDGYGIVISLLFIIERVSASRAALFSCWTVDNMMMYTHCIDHQVTIRQKQY